MPGWNTLDLSLGKNINMGKAGHLTIRAAVKNIFDTRYELSSGYPMPGRSIIGGIEYKF
jgi:outer membrane receptor protein involved in Fe transport